MGISALQYQKRLNPLLSLNYLQSKVRNIVISDQKTLKQEKIDEFEQGLRPDGNIIGEYRSKDYQEYKYSQNPLARGNVDLILTRSFTNKLFVKGSDSKFIFDSSDIKTGNLIGKYGRDIMGLNQDWFNIRQNDIYRLVLVEQIKREQNIG